MAPMALPFKPTQNGLPQYVVSRRQIRRGLPVSARLMRFRRIAVILFLVSLFCLWLFIPRKGSLTTLSEQEQQNDINSPEALPRFPDDLLTKNDDSTEQQQQQQQEQQKNPSDKITKIDQNFKPHHDAANPTDDSLSQEDFYDAQQDEQEQWKLEQALEQEQQEQEQDKLSEPVQEKKPEPEPIKKNKPSKSSSKSKSRPQSADSGSRRVVDANDIREASRREAIAEWESKLDQGVITRDLLAELVKRVPVVVFSKSTCPFSRRAKEMLRSMDLVPEPYIIEADLTSHLSEIKSLLTDMTHHSTFPNIHIGGIHRGGADDLEELAQSSKLKQYLYDAGVTVQKDVQLNPV